MKNILKTIAVLFSVSLISVVAKAGELAVSGSAKASYLISSGKNNSGKALGISNELMFKASGELDNGFTWDYHTELDMADGGAASNDDTAIVFGLGDLGKLGIYDAEGGLSTELAYGIGAMGTGADYANTMTNIGWGYDVSADPHIAYKNGGAAVAMDADGSTATQYKVTAAPIDGLKIGADYYETGGNIATGTVTEKTGGNVYAQYAMGNFKIGIYSGELETAKSDKYATASADSATALNGDMYESDGYGIEFAVNDSLSISYNSEEFARIDKTMATTASTSTKTTQWVVLQ